MGRLLCNIHSPHCRHTNLLLLRERERGKEKRKTKLVSSDNKGEENETKTKKSSHSPQTKTRPWTPLSPPALLISLLCPRFSLSLSPSFLPLPLSLVFLSFTLIQSGCGIDDGNEEEDEKGGNLTPSAPRCLPLCSRPLSPASSAQTRPSPRPRPPPPSPCCQAPARRRWGEARGR